MVTSLCNMRRLKLYSSVCIRWLDRVFLATSEWGGCMRQGHYLDARKRFIIDRILNAIFFLRTLKPLNYLKSFFFYWLRLHFNRCTIYFV